MLCCVIVKECHQRIQTALILKSSGEIDKGRNFLQLAQEENNHLPRVLMTLATVKRMGLSLVSRHPSQDGLRLSVVTSSAAVFFWEK